MISRGLLFVIIIILLSEVPLFASEKVLGVAPKLIDLAMEAKILLFQRRYNEAEQLFDKIEKEFPDSPTGLAGKMGIWQLKMFENWDFSYINQYNEAEKAYRSFATRQLRKGDVPSWDLFIYGTADGITAYFRLRQERWFAALSKGLHSMRMFKELSWKEPDMVDLNLPFGAYKYWRSAITKEIKILPFYSDQREEGFALTKKAYQHGKYVKEPALANLIFMYDNDKRWDDALKYTNIFLKEFPENVIIKFNKGHLLISLKRYDEALGVFKEVYSEAPNVKKAVLYEGKALIFMKKFPEAKQKIDNYLKIAMDDLGKSSAYFWLGYIAEVEKNYPEARKNYEKSMTFHKNEGAKKRLKKLQSHSK